MHFKARKKFATHGRGIELDLYQYCHYNPFNTRNCTSIMLIIKNGETFYVNDWRGVYYWDNISCVLSFGTCTGSLEPASVTARRILMM